MKLDKSKQKEINKICVVGLGYIGLPTASMLAIQGYKVIGVDIDEERVKTIRDGKLIINEQGLMTLLTGAITSGNLVVKTEPEEADVYIICVPTPATADKNGKKCDLICVLSAVNNIKPYLKDGDLIIIESTIPPKTTEKIYDDISKNTGKNIYMAYCPERVLPGNILKELVENDRTIGGINKKSAQLAKEIYASFIEGNLYITDSTTAEMVKLMENTFRDVNIALANEFAKVSTELDINVWDAINLANKHPRVNILNPGPGVGGHCISIDPWFIVGSSENAELIKKARNLNDDMPKYVASLIIKEFKEMGICNPKVGIFGITYKGDVEDTRETPARAIIDYLLQNDFEVSIYDPYAKDFEYPLNTIEESIKNSDALIFLTDHSEFKNFEKEDIKEISHMMKNKIVMDMKNTLNHNLWEEQGFNVKLLGDGKSWIVKTL
ncbi:nucleotide sugar dehydrogenase [Methanococcus aeolicus]|uniref:UDP-N-acetyl-D-mannosamine dehydrogenase n=1 Tax=Methanococcus aeolicus (strain ATCC BAA-1280 / DSM 17508 / OCM 812 / Nankai-3) TaxID=419665 RepID=WECC_META3|nr:nucleotide sugar dehydrogenase [Methanococcus aeolicus]A6UU98.1 RecName: Full=UDP-N-acetyl-D-mannosamine dehydrogenase; AltName: Full=UDP-ManNAc 6-dehydrogenase [Methanococcus aeolicus Nankai-3]ABR56070.1 UDP-glucose/GDP-mannose dehydrogenase [Methanococcus aeolicus Nankai-3]UXM85325.1 nucleotide sugar dehydrogenase [Methanococcus aeolicus]